MRQKTAPTDQTAILGVWRLKSYYLEELQTGGRTDVFGPNPNGVLTLLPEGRMFALLTPEQQEQVKKLQAQRESRDDRRADRQGDRRERLQQQPKRP